MIACSQCGRSPGVDEGDDVVPYDWMTDRDRGRLTVVCPTYAREHSRAIEGKLDQAWW